MKIYRLIFLSRCYILNCKLAKHTHLTEIQNTFNKQKNKQDQEKLTASVEEVGCLATCGRSASVSKLAVGANSWILLRKNNGI